MQSVTVTIGRNVTGADELPAQAWRKFRDNTAATVRRFGFDLTAQADGAGYWEGTTEDNHVIVGIREGSLTELEREGFRQWVAELAAGYRQEAIAVAFGESELVASAASGQSDPFTAVIRSHYSI